VIGRPSQAGADAPRDAWSTLRRGKSRPMRAKLGAKRATIAYIQGRATCGNM
jgi:hypothetical protein